MSEILAVACGLFTGIASSLVPGLHVALVLALFVTAGVPALFGGAGAVLFLATAAGAALYVRRLAMVYHPGAGAEEQASLDPALKLTSEGRGRDALKLMLLGTDVAWLPVAVFASLLVGCALSGVNGARALDGLIGWLGLPVIGFWVLHTIARAQSRGLTALAFGLVGVYGYTVLHAPVLTGSEHQMALLMNGMFGAPIAYALWRERTVALPAQRPATPVLVASLPLAIVGAVFGCLAGFFPGLGTGSLVSMARGWCQGTEDYLVLTSAGETSNDGLALLLVLIAGMGRSGEAVLLGRVAGQLPLLSGFLVFAAVAFGAYVGRRFVLRYQDTYERCIRRLPARAGVVLVFILIAGQILLSGHVVLATVLVAAGAALAWWTRQAGLPTQVGFGAIALPLVAQVLGFVPGLNALLFS